MTRFAIYVHIDGGRYRVEVIEDGKTQLKVRFTEHDAAALHLASECWLPRSSFRVDKEGEE